MEDIIIGIILVGILGGAILYLINAKKKGVTCVGCPNAKTCTKRGACDSLSK